MLGVQGRDRTMYGVLLDSIFEVMREQFDAEQLAKIQRLAGYNPDNEINEFQRYSDTLIPRLTSAAHRVAGISPDQVSTINILNTTLQFQYLC